LCGLVPCPSALRLCASFCLSELRFLVRTLAVLSQALLLFLALAVGLLTRSALHAWSAHKRLKFGEGHFHLQLATLPLKLLHQLVDFFTCVCHDVLDRSWTGPLSTP
jgi:hypothetical protein